MKVEVDEGRKRLVVSGYFPGSPLKPSGMKKLLFGSVHVHGFALDRIEWRSFYKDRKVTFINLDGSFDTAQEVLEEIDKLGFKFAPFFDVFTINFRNLNDPDFVQNYPNITLEPSFCRGLYYFMAFNFLTPGCWIDFTNKILFNETLWYACVPK